MGVGVDVSRPPPPLPPPLLPLGERVGEGVKSPEGVP